MLHWGFIGCGDVVKRKSGAAFWIDGKSDVVTVMSRDVKHCKEYAQENNIPYYCTSAEELINSEKVNAVYVATPPASHTEYAKMAILAGKSVYVEKPLGMTYEECCSISSLAEKYNVGVYTAFYRRALPYFQKLKELIRDGELGNIRQVIIRQSKKYSNNLLENSWRLKPEISGGGLFNDIGCHAVDIIMYLLGEYTEYEIYSENQKESSSVDDAVSMMFRIGKVLGVGVWCYDSFNNYDRTEIIGDKGKVVFSITQLDSFSVIVNGDEKKYFFEIEKLPQKYMVSNVVDSILGLAEPLCCLKEACMVSKIIDDKKFWSDRY